MLRMTVSLGAALALSACINASQATSGKAYLERYAEAEGRAAGPLAGSGPAGPAFERPRTDQMIREAAASEPDLKLPARFGLARIVNGSLSAVPATEGELWKAAAQRYSMFGEFVAISPLLAAWSDQDWKAGSADPRGVIRAIRLGAARQHVDAVLVYEVGADASREATFFSLADLTIVGGAFLPTRDVKAVGRAEALLIDVRNGYPYGMASARADLRTFHPSWGAEHRTAELRDQVVLKVVETLVPEAETMFRDVVAAALARQGSSAAPATR